MNWSTQQKEITINDTNFFINPKEEPDPDKSEIINLIINYVKSINAKDTNAYNSVFTTESASVKVDLYFNESTDVKLLYTEGQFVLLKVNNSTFAPRKKA